LREALEQMKVELVDEGIKVKFAPDHDDLKKCAELGHKMAKIIKDRSAA
jgi:flavorubredoxin